MIMAFTIILIMMVMVHRRATKYATKPSVDVDSIVASTIMYLCNTGYLDYSTEDSGKIVLHILEFEEDETDGSSNGKADSDEKEES